MRLIEISRYPVKSLLGERVAAAEVDARGVAGDRLWAVRDESGKLGSGKSTRRFRHMPGLFTMRGRGDGVVPVVELPDGRRFRADDPAGHAAVSDVLGRRVTLTREAGVAHHDEGAVSIVTTAALRELGALVGRPVDPLRFRANLLVETPGDGFAEDGWIGGALRVGRDVLLRPRARLTRCAMIDFAQEHLPEHGRLLKTVAEHHDLTFGVWASVERTGRIAVGDRVRFTADA